MIGCSLAKRKIVDFRNEILPCAAENETKENKARQTSNCIFGFY